MAGIPVLVQQGLNAEAIAARLGCTVGTSRCAARRLRSACAYPKRSRWCRWCPVPATAKPPKQKRCFAFAVPTTLQLSKVAMSRLRQRAEAIGMNEAELVTKLLEVIAQDDLFDAVLTRQRCCVNPIKSGMRGLKYIQASPSRGPGLRYFSSQYFGSYEAGSSSKPFGINAPSNVRFRG